MDLWKKAKSPNYETHKDKLYPYSEMPFQNEYKLVKIPFCVKNLIEHVDYFGSGRIESVAGTLGFSNCYNVNYEFRLVLGGPDKGRKIPNMIPMSEGTIFGSSTRNYIKDNSVHTVTVNLIKETVTEIIAQDIARIVNNQWGKVIVYGENDEEIEILTDELKKMKQLYYCPFYIFPDNLQLTYYHCYRAYLSINELKKELYKNVNRGDIAAAVRLTGCLSDTYCGGALTEVVDKLLANNVANVIVYACKLWNNNNREVVREHFPSVFQHIFDGDSMAIINDRNNQALVLKPKTKDSHYKSSKQSGWKIIPIWDDEDDKVLFKLYNFDSGMHLELPSAGTDDGVRQASGSNDSKELGAKFNFEPVMTMNGQVAFNIFNDEDNKRLELSVDVDTSEVKAVAGHSSGASDQDGCSSWILTTSSQGKEKSHKKDELAQNEDEDFSNIYNYD